MQIISGIVWAVLKAVELILIIRAIMSWLPIPGGIIDVLEAVTEPIILPARVLFEKLGISLPIPIDLPFLTTLILIPVLESMLYV